MKFFLTSEDRKLQALLKLLKPDVDKSHMAAAVRLGDPDAVRRLHVNNFDVNEPESAFSGNRTALFYAVLNNDVNMAQLLIELGAKTNVRDLVKRTDDPTKTVMKTPLEYAVATTKNLEMVKVLIEQGNANVYEELSDFYMTDTTREIIVYIANVQQTHHTRSMKECATFFSALAQFKEHFDSVDKATQNTLIKNLKEQDAHNINWLTETLLPVQPQKIVDVKSTIEVAPDNQNHR